MLRFFARRAMDRELHHGGLIDQLHPEFAEFAPVYTESPGSRREHGSAGRYGAIVGLGVDGAIAVG